LVTAAVYSLYVDVYLTLVVAAGDVDVVVVE
jgi:hypothetical protein